MNCLIIDDDKETSITLQRLLRMNPLIKSIHCSLHYNLIYSLIANHSIDLLFIQVRLWDFRIMQTLDKMPIVVFLSGGKSKLSDRPVTLVPFSLREPFTRKKLDKLLIEVDRSKFTEDPNYFFPKYDGRFHRIFFDDIEILETVKNNYVKMITKRGICLLPGSLSFWFDQLPEQQFIRASDMIVLPVEEMKKIKGDEYLFRRRCIKIAFHFVDAGKNGKEVYPVRRPQMKLEAS